MSDDELYLYLEICYNKQDWKNYDAIFEILRLKGNFNEV